MSKIKLSKDFILNTVKRALNEDLYPLGDITSNLVKNNKIVKVKILSNQNAIIGGLLFAKQTFDLIDRKVEENRKVFFVAGETDTTDREAIRAIVEKQKNSVIVASLGTFSTGINIRNLHNIVFASPSKSQIRVLQSIGRGLRKTDDGKSTTLYDIVDDISWKSRKNYGILHADERLRIYGREKFTHKTYRVEL